MNNKSNIFEELNKMKSLIHAKSGTVISEQAEDPIETIRKGISSMAINDSNEQSIVDTIVNNYKTKEQFVNFLSQFKQKNGKEFADAVRSTITPTEPQWGALVKHLASIGVTMKQKTSNNRYNGITFEGLGGSVNRQQSITANYCAVKDGKIRHSNGAIFDWNTYASSNKVTEAEIAEAKKTCPNVVVPPATGTPAAAAAAAAGPTPAQKFTATATSLGIQNPKMDVATLQTILNTLNQGGSGLTESKNLVNEELNKMKYMLGYQRGRVISEQDAAQPQPAATQQAQPAATQQAQPAATQQATPKDLIRQIQTVLKTKYNANLGKFGLKGDGIDEKWGNLTQTALDNALKSIADVKQKRATETQQTTTQDTAIQQAAETGRMAIPQTNNLPTQSGIQQRPQVAGVQTK
jgi:hypothetical protein